MIKLTRSNEQKVDASNVQLNALESNVIRLEKVFGERRASKLEAQQETRIFEIQEVDRRRKLKNFITTERGGSVAQTVKRYTERALGPIERMIKALESLALGWLLNQLPQIFNLVEQQVVPRVVTVFTGMKNIVSSVVNIIFSLGSIAQSIGDSLFSFKSLDTELIGKEFDSITGEIESMGRDFGNSIMAAFGQPYEKSQEASDAQAYLEGLGQDEKPTPAPSGGATPAPTQGEFKGTASQKAVTIAKKLQKDLGLKDYQAAAIVGNLTQENTNLVPDLKEGGKKGLLPEVMPGKAGYGWAQWTYPTRQKELYDLAKKMGVNPDKQPLTDEVNYAMLVREFPRYDSGGRFRNSKNIEEAANWLLEQYFKPRDRGPREQKERIADSKAVLSKMRGKGSGVKTRTSTNRKLTTGAVFGDTGRVSNAAGWVHGHFQDNSRTALLNNTFPVVKKLLQQGVSVYITGGGADIALSKNMSDDQLKKAINSGIDKHSNRTRGYFAVDVSVPRGTKVPIALEDVRAAGDASGVSGLIPGTNTFIGHLTPSSVSGTAEEIAQTKQEMSMIAAAPSSGAQKTAPLAQQMPYDKRQGNTIIMAQQSSMPMSFSGSVISSGSGTEVGGPDIGTLLNNMHKARFLTQLAYT